MKHIKNVYLIGIGGIGMSNLARYFHSQHKNIAGYDSTPSDITKDLTALGMDICYEDSLDLIPPPFKAKEQTLVIYTPAIPETHRGYQYFKNKGFTLMKRARVLGAITKDTFCLAVAGTHGKTTTSAILGHIMRACHTGATAFLGGVLMGEESNLILGTQPISVVEADEFDRSFLQLHPDIACINSMDADHLDIYQNTDALREAFQDFAGRVTQTLLVAKGLPIKGLTYAVEDDTADYYIDHIRLEDGTTIFDVHTPKGSVREVVFQLPGKHNLVNALAAIAMAQHYGLPLKDIVATLAAFKGVKRRFNYRIRNQQRVLIDDYAHHPTEIDAIAQTLRQYYPHDEILVVFQPHLFSRTRDFADDFAKSLAGFDALFLLDIYPARELPMEGITSDWLLEKVPMHNKQKVSSVGLGAAILKAPQRVVAMLGAGDIGVMVDEVTAVLLN